MLLVVVVSWAGAYYHTWTELALGPLRPENSIPGIIGLVLFLGWWRGPGSKRIWASLLLFWTVAAQLIAGAILSAVPLPVWPFVPEQTTGHYLTHVWYGLAQFPLIYVLLRWAILKHPEDVAGAQAND
jgi:hypothetical protein